MAGKQECTEGQLCPTFLLIVGPRWPCHKGAAIVLFDRCHLNVSRSSFDAKTAEDTAGRADWKINASGVDGCHRP